MATISQWDRTLILVALNKLGKHIYEGTANRKTVAKRHAKNRVAKQSRKVNR